jgi:hypothetical protein
MKTKFGILTMSLLMMCLFSFAKGTGTALISGHSATNLGEYSINLAPEAITVGNEVLKTYELAYSNGNSPISIGVKKTKKCMNFIVRTNNFEVEYICNKHVFGVKRISKEYQTISESLINELMDNADFYRQRVISQNPKTEEELLGLIACYFPMLIKDDHLADL